MLEEPRLLLTGSQAPRGAAPPCPQSRAPASCGPRTSGPGAPHAEATAVQNQVYLASTTALATCWLCGHGQLAGPLPLSFLLASQMISFLHAGVKKHPAFRTLMMSEEGIKNLSARRRTAGMW